MRNYTDPARGYLSLPTMLTWIRIALFVVLIIVHVTTAGIGRDYWLAAIFLLAAITDWGDGMLARKLKQSSPFGAFLDPVADKLIVMGALVILVDLSRVPAWLTILLIGRELVIASLREWTALSRISLAVKPSGKAKTLLQMLAIFFLFLPPRPWNSIMGEVLIYGALFFAIFSAVQYAFTAMIAIQNHTPNHH